MNQIEVNLRQTVIEITPGSVWCFGPVAKPELLYILSRISTHNFQFIGLISGVAFSYRQMTEDEIIDFLDRHPTYWRLPEGSEIKIKLGA